MWYETSNSLRVSIKCLWNLRLKSRYVYKLSIRKNSVSTQTSKPTERITPQTEFISVGSKEYKRDDWTNVTQKISSLVGRNLHKEKYHPLNLVCKSIVNFMYKSFVNRKGNPLFSVYDIMSPVVTTKQNFDSLLIPANHPSRSKSDSYYLNAGHILRSHTSAHQHELIQSGLDNFLVIGDVYRRDEIDAKHYPAFHQVEAVRLCSHDQVFRNVKNSDTLIIFEDGERSPEKQECHSSSAVQQMEAEMKTTLEGLVKHLLGPELECRWVDTYFPFTHPSWELEIKHEGKWMELLGCGIMEQKLLHSAGAGSKIGWAFGLGLERLAMLMFHIPDIRLFWSTDSGFLSQFHVDEIKSPIKYKPISQFPQCINDMSFWIPEVFCANDFFDLVRTVGGDTVEQVELVDQFTHPKSGRVSHCYRIVYRHMEKTLVQEEVNNLHKLIEDNATKLLGVQVR